MIPIQRDIVDPLRGVIGASLTSVSYRPLVGEYSPEEIENSSFYIGGEVALAFDNGEMRYFSWVETGDYESHFSLAVRPISHFSEGSLDELDASSTELWADSIGAPLTGLECFGWEDTPHVIKLDFEHSRKLIGSAWRTHFGDADDIYFCDAKDLGDHLEGSESLWKSTNGEQVAACNPLPVK